MESAQDSGPAMAQFVEDMGLAFEGSGSSRMAGRMLGWLLVCEPTHQSAEQLAAGLHASSGSVSTTTRLLIQIGFIERVARPADRRAYYRLRPDAWGASLEQSQAQMGAYRALAEKGLAALGDVPEPHRRRLQEMRELFAFVESEFPALVERFHQARRRDRASSRTPEATSGRDGRGGPP
jgi:DNA-binding MarR family transcriptional regulator